jgi:hypothetical protein
MLPFRAPLPQPGEQLRWRHPRRALALGWFHVFGPGPFEFIDLVEDRGQDAPLTYLIRTEFGPKPVDAAWVGPISTLVGSKPVNGTHVDPTGAPRPGQK